MKKTRSVQRLYLGCLLAAWGLMGLGGCNDESLAPWESSSNSGDDDDGDGNGDDDGDGDGVGDGDEDGVGGNSNICDDYPEGPYGFHAGDVIKNYVFFDRTDTPIELCEYAERGHKQLLIVLTAARAL